MTSLHSLPLFFIVQMTANRISEMNFYIFLSFYVCSVLDITYLKTRSQEDILKLFSNFQLGLVTCETIEEAVKNHKVDE